MDLKGKKVLVVGAGRSGLAAVQKLNKIKAEVFLTDKQESSALKGIEGLGLDECHVLAGQEPDIEELNPALLVLSPGVPPQLPFIQMAIKKGIPVWSEVELALRNHPAYKIGVTGSNGKTTTTSLIGELAKKTGKNSIVAGNIGHALSGLVDEVAAEGIIVAELSSFQLEFIEKLRLNIAVYLNLTPDHLDRHGSMENYAGAKVRIFENQTKGDLAILNWDNPVIRSLGDKLTARICYFSTSQPLEHGFFLSGNDIVFAEKGKLTKVISGEELKLRGNHNMENVMAAIAAGKELGLAFAEIAEVLKEFSPVEHRQEIVGRFRGILYINDSKGTSPDSSIKALQSFKEPIVLIAGGRNKGLDFTDFLLEAKKRVKSLILVGEAAAEIEELARKIGIKAIRRSVSFEDCVKKAIRDAEEGDVVLLSPACTSWDMFKSYEERGELFRQLVRKYYSEPV